MITARPTIFVSAVSRELKSARQLVANTLTSLGYEPVWQDIFGTEQGDLRGMLRRKVDDCTGVVQLVGARYGAEPPTPDEEFGRVSYTQYEALYAKKQGKKIWYLILDKSFPVDPVEPEPDELRELQAAYLRRLQGDSNLYYPLNSRDALETSVLKLRDDLARLRRGIKQWAMAVIALLLILVGAVFWINHELRVTEYGIDQLLRQGAPPAPMGNAAPQAMPAANMRYAQAAYHQPSPTSADEALHPKLAFAVFGLGQGATNWIALGPETSLRSGEHFFIRAETFSPGYLYIFQVDSSGKLQWLFPANPTCPFSYGANPLPAQVALTIPNGDNQAYALDDVVGEERVYAIYSATRWEKLEAALEQSGKNPTGPAQHDIETLLASDDTVSERSKGIVRVENTTVAKEVKQAAAPDAQPYLVDLPTHALQANGYWLMEVRRFHHTARNAKP